MFEDGTVVGAGASSGGFDRRPLTFCRDVSGRAGSSPGGAVLRMKSARSCVSVFGLVSEFANFGALVSYTLDGHTTYLCCSG